MAYERHQERTGETMGHFKLLEYKYDTEKKRHFYFTHCALCDETKWMNYKNITKRKRDGCGCQWRVKHRKDITGQTFGRLTAIRPSEKSCHTGVIWECECSCGNEVLLPTSRLLCGKTRSCGCFQVDTFTQSCNDLAERVLVEGTRLTALIMKVPKNNTSGVKGVSWIKESQKWKTVIKFQGKVIQLGRFEDIEDAIKARQKAEEKYFKPILEKYKDRLIPSLLARMSKKIRMI